MDSLKDLRSYVKTINKDFTVKTIGDLDIFNKKLYAVYHNQQRLTPFYSVKEWSGFKLMKLELTK